MLIKQTCTPKSPEKKVSVWATLSFLIISLGLMILSFHSTCNGQSGSFSISSTSSFGTYDLNYDQAPGSQTGDTAIFVLVYVEIGESDEFPSLDVSVPPASWLFDSAGTTINVIPKDILSGWASFLVEATRGDGVEQYGSGVVLRLADTEGIGVIVLDFPGKKPEELDGEITITHSKDEFKFSSGNPLKAISLYSLEGHFIDGIAGGEFIGWSCPKPCGQGIILVRIELKDGRFLHRKIYYGE